MAEPYKVSSSSSPFDALPEELLHLILGKCASDMHRAGTEIHPEDSTLASCRLVCSKWAEVGAKQLTTMIVHPFRDLEDEFIQSLADLLETKAKQISKLRARLKDLRYWEERETKRKGEMRKGVPELLYVLGDHEWVEMTLGGGAAYKEVWRSSGETLKNLTSDVLATPWSPKYHDAANTYWNQYPELFATLSKLEVLEHLDMAFHPWALHSQEGMEFKTVRKLVLRTEWRGRREFTINGVHIEGWAVGFGTLRRLFPNVVELELHVWSMVGEDGFEDGWTWEDLKKLTIGGGTDGDDRRGYAPEDFVIDAFENAAWTGVEELTLRGVVNSGAPLGFYWAYISLLMRFPKLRRLEAVHDSVGPWEGWWAGECGRTFGEGDHYQGRAF
jgi:hypothetical protein